MPPSIALRDLKDSLVIADELLRIERRDYHNPPRANEVKPVQGLRGAAAVFVVAAFEQFLRAAIEEHLTKLGKISPASFQTLPDDIRINSTYRTLEYAMKGYPHASQKPRKDRLGDINQACKIIIAATVAPSAFSNTNGNPNSNTVRQMLSDCDINDIFGIVHNDFVRKWRAPIAHTFIRDKLDEIVQRRHLVAHTANALNISRSQLKESLKFLRVLSELIDVQLGKKIKAVLILAGIR